MASNVTSAGAASGMDFESIISASLELKKQQLTKQTTYKKETTNIELSGVGKLKSALKTFQDALKGLKDESGFNVRKVTSSLTTEEGKTPAFTVTAGEDASNGEYSIGVKQVARSESISQTFQKGADDSVKFAAGTYTFKVPQYGEDDKIEYKEVSIELDKEATIDEFRRKINSTLGDMGVTASVVHGKDGSQLSLNFGITGEEARDGISIKYEAAAGVSPDSAAAKNSEALNYTANAVTDSGKGDNTGKYNAWNVKKAQDAVIMVDGQEIVSGTNTFKNQISGLTVNVNSTTLNKDDPKAVDSYDVKVEQDIDGLTTKVQNFITAYNSLRDTMNSLGKRNTYSDAQNNYDGGELAGDSQLISLERQLQNVMTSLSGVDLGNGTTVDLYSMGLEVDNDGKFSLDATKFKESADKNFNALVKLFTNDPETPSKNDPEGLIIKLNNIVDEFTKTNGLLDEREKYLQDILRDVADEEAANNDYLTQYEENLRKKYAILDTTIANFNNSMTYLNSVLG